MNAVTSVRPFVASEPLLSIRGLHKSFARGLARAERRTSALAGVDLHLTGGEILGIVGPEGAGKTTLLQCAAGLLRRDAGTVTWFGETFHGGGCLPQLAYVPAVPVYYPFLTVRDVLEHRAAREDVSPRRRATLIEAAAARLGFSDRSDARVAGLSRAEVTLLALAEALVGEPRIILLDTATSDSSPLCPAIAAEELIAEAARGAGIIIASREAHSVAVAASRLVFLDHGRVRGSFSADDADHVEMSFEPAGMPVARLVAERVH